MSAAIAEIFLSTKKYRNVRHGNKQVALSIDDLESVDPWKPRGIKVKLQSEQGEEKEAVEAVKQLRSAGFAVNDIVTGCGVMKASHLHDVDDLRSALEQSGGLMQANKKMHEESIALKSSNEKARAELEQLLVECKSRAAFRDHMEKQAKYFQLQAEMGPLLQAVAGSSNCSTGEAADAIEFVLEAGLKQLPRKASCRTSLERALYAVRNDLTIGRPVNLFS